MKKSIYNFLWYIPMAKEILLLTKNVPWAPFSPINNLYVTHEPLSNEVLKKVEAYKKDHPDEMITYKLIQKKFM